MSGHVQGLDIAAAAGPTTGKASASTPDGAGAVARPGTPQPGGTEPRAAPESPATAPVWKTICRVDDIPKLGARRVTRPRGADIAVFRTADDRVFALLDRCPHKGGPLSQGIVFGESVACPLHNWTIGLADGCAAAPDVGCVQRFSVQVDAGAVALDLAELARPDAEADPAAAPAARGGNDAAQTAPGADSY